eukprot:301696-Hanusia_phi.AAC.1
MIIGSDHDSGARPGRGPPSPGYAPAAARPGRGPLSFGACLSLSGSRAREPESDPSRTEPAVTDGVSPGRSLVQGPWMICGASSMVVVCPLIGPLTQAQIEFRVP